MRQLQLALICLFLFGCHDYDSLTSGQVEYGKTKGQTPVIVLAASMDDTLTGNGLTPIAPMLKDAGFSVISLDLPCHGKDAQEANGLECWRRRIEGGDRTLFDTFCKDLSSVIDDLGVSSIAVVGVSRGGYVSMYCAARDSRIDRLALLAPVVDLTVLEEFNGLSLDPLFEIQKGALANDPILVRIGKHDARVSTARVLSFFADMPNATVQLLDTEGHVATEDGSTLIWLAQHGDVPLSASGR